MYETLLLDMYVRLRYITYIWNFARIKNKRKLNKEKEKKQKTKITKKKKKQKKKKTTRKNELRGAHPPWGHTHACRHAVQGSNGCMPPCAVHPPPSPHAGPTHVGSPNYFRRPPVSSPTGWRHWNHHCDGRHRWCWWGGSWVGGIGGSVLGLDAGWRWSVCAVRISVDLGFACKMGWAEQVHGPKCWFGGLKARSFRGNFPGTKQEPEIWSRNTLNQIRRIFWIFPVFLFFLWKRYIIG